MLVESKRNVFQKCCKTGVQWTNEVVEVVITLFLLAGEAKLVLSSSMNVAYEFYKSSYILSTRYYEICI